MVSSPSGCVWGGWHRDGGIWSVNSAVFKGSNEKTFSRSNGHKSEGFEDKVVNFSVRAQFVSVMHSNKIFLLPNIIITLLHGRLK